MMQQRADIRAAIDRRPAQRAAQQLVASLHAAGVPILLGSDEIGIPGVVPGFAIQGELRQLREAGLSPFDVLATGSRNAGRFIKQHFRDSDTFGVIEAGARADLVLLTKNPLDSVEGFSKPAGVMAAGRWYPELWLSEQLDRLRHTR